MKKNKFYAVKNGRKNGTFLNWNDCKEMIDSFPNASYKSFENPYDAIDFLTDYRYIKNLANKSQKFESEENINKNQYIDTDSKNDDTYEAYVDGSFDSSNMIYGSGVVILKNGNVIETMSKKGENIEYVSMRNVAGEIEGSILAMEYALNNDIKEITIYFDYNGIEKWCTGEWKTNKEGTKYYKQFYDDAKKSLKINFRKVEAHTGVEFNELADKLAKESIF